MGAEQPYIYTTPVTRDSGYDYDFNPRAYSQAAYAASLEKETPTRKQDGPLINFNKHPDSWGVIQNENNADPLPDNMRSKIVSVRWTQFSLRIVQLLIDLGLIVCAVVLQGAGAITEWIIRIPPIWDAIINVYAIYNLFRPASERPIGSTMAYCFFALIMDTVLLPFYVYIGYTAHAQSTESSQGSSQWSTMFEIPAATGTILTVTSIVAFVLAALHLISATLNILLLLWYRTVSKQPPDMNPLDTSDSRRLKSADGSSTASDLKASYRVSTISVSTNASIPAGYSIPALDNREVPFFRSRVDADSRWSPAALASARGLPSRPESMTSAMYPSMNNSRQSSPTRHSQADTFSSNSPSESAGLLRHGRQVAPQVSQTQQYQPHTQLYPVRSQAPPLARKNSWEANDEEIDISASRGISPAPPIPKKSDSRYLSPYKDINKENVGASGGPKRMMTISSSVYSDDGAASVASNSTVRSPKAYGVLSAQQAFRYDGGSRVPSPERPEYIAQRHPSTGVDLAEAHMYEAPRQRNFSWRAAEQSRGTRKFDHGNWI